MFRKHFVAAAPILLLVSGCASFEGVPQDVVSVDDQLAPLQLYFAPGVLAKYAALTGDARQKYRNEVVYARLSAYDARFYQFERTLGGETGGLNLGADLLTLTLNGLGTTVGDAATKAALAAASAGVVGAKGAISKDLFYEKTLPAITAQMEAGRAKARATIEAGLAKSDAEYSLPEAFVDLNLYQAAGTLEGAINSIVQDAGSAVTAADQEIKFTREPSFTSALPATRALLARLKSLTPAQAVSVANAMEPSLGTRASGIQDLVRGLDPQTARLKDGAVAQRVLQAWLIVDDRDATSQQQWSSAIDAAVK